jgi:ribulose-phosphate 3-epimerase
MRGKISASMMCADLLHLEDSIRALEENGVELLHCDVMDGHFVPNWMLFPEMINAIAQSTAVPLDVHLMTDAPQDFLRTLKLRRGDYVSVHYESTAHVQRVIAAIRDCGCIPALAINPATPLVAAQEMLPEIGMLLLMTVNPGYSGQTLAPNGISKIARAKRMLADSGFPEILLEVDGNCSLENAPRMMAAGADVLVAGSSSVFKPGLTVEQGVRALRSAMASNAQ